MNARLIPLVFLVILGFPGPLRAGMTSYNLDSLVALRLEDISFFVVLVLVSGWGFKLLWNCAFRDMPKVPRLTYRPALALTFTLGLAMLLVLSMISGARELLTPGAWKRQGNGYKLTSPASLEQRQAKLFSLHAALKAYAEGHGGKLPPHDYVPELPAGLWQAPDESGSRYVYLGGLSGNLTTKIVAYEPPSFGNQRFVLFGDGSIREMETKEILNQLSWKEKP